MIDLFELDKRVARLQALLDREKLETKDDRERARAADPFADLRDVAGQSTFRALEKADTLALDHRDGLRRWVYELLQRRVARDLFLDEADAIATAPADDPNPTFAGALGAFVEAPNVVLAEQAWSRLEELAPPVAAVRREIRARREEAARRLELEHPWALVAPRAGLVALATRVLDATEALAGELREDVPPARAVLAGFGRDALEGWPAHLGKRWLDDLFRAVAPRSPTMPKEIRSVGGASFVLAADVWGRSLRHASVPRSLPFALARDPYPTAAFTFGGLFGAVLADRVFARRKLGLTTRSADAHWRALGRVVFLELRRRAGQVLTLVRPDSAGEVTARVFGRPLDEAMADLWATGGFSGLARVDAPARLAGAVRAFDLGRVLVERFDEDWFDNPRAATHLASIGSAPVNEPFEELEVAAVARAFEERLG